MASTEQAALGRKLVRTRDSGVLSTMSRELPGYPFGSVTPYVMTHEGDVAFYVSSLAQHTKNMDADPRASLTVLEEGAGNQQALGRVTLIGDARRVPEATVDTVAERYFRLFPEARDYAVTHDFAFYGIAPMRVRYIGGFGQIFWVEPDEWRLPTPAWAAEEQGILEHMNADHVDALADIARCHVAADARPAGEPVLVAVDAEGAHVHWGEHVVYAPFDAPAFDSAAMREAMIRLTRNARSRTPGDG